MNKKHENYKELVWRLAKTDFKLRYRNSFLGYIWVILKPLLMFTILNFVFSSVFNLRNTGNPYYPLELLTALLLFQFFSEATTRGMTSLVIKAQLVTKIYIPRWTIVLASTMNALFIFGMNLIVLAFFFFIYNKIPTLSGLVMFVIYSFLLYVLAVAFSFLTSAFYVRFLDLAMIWEVLLSVLMYASPIIYPLALLPSNIQNLILLNPLAFIINFAKQGLINNIFADWWHIVVFTVCVSISLWVSILIFIRYEKRVAEII